mgnify:FL=1
MNLERFGQFISEDIPHKVEKGCQGGCGRALIIIGLLAASAGAGYLITRDEVQNLMEPLIPDETTPQSFPSDR